MLSYQHSYHAGGPADVHKHLALAELFKLLTQKDRGISYLETHAGRGLYHLDAEESLKTGEAAEGIARIDDGREGPFFEALQSVRAAHGPQAYPGSPMVAAALLRPQDRIVLMEKHPQEVVALKRAMKRTQAEVHARDGYEGSLAVSPMEPRRGLILIDPSYEIKTEYRQAADHVNRLASHWGEAAIVVWYPILKAGRHEDIFAALKGPALRHEVLFDLKGGSGMVGSGLAIVSAPFGTEAVLERVMEQGRGVLRKA